MTPFSISHDFTSSADELWKVVADPSYHRELYESAQVDRELLEERTEAGATVLVARCTSRRRLPAFVEKLAGGPLGFTETVVLRHRQRRLEQRVSPSVFAQRTRFQSVMRVDSLPQGGCRRVLEGELEISIPVLGARIERATLRDMKRVQELAVELARDRLSAG